MICFALRRSRNHADPALAEPTAATTRWRVSALPSPPPLPHAPKTPGLARARWRLDLLHSRGGEPASWIVEASDATGHPIFLATWPTDRLRRLSGAAVPPPNRPLVTAVHDARRQSVAALDAAARSEGLWNDSVGPGTLNCDPQTVRKWRAHFFTRRIEGLRDEPRSGAPRSIDANGSRG